MNRIQHSTRPIRYTSPHPPFSIESGLFTLPRHDYPSLFFGPKHYEPNYAYPLIVWLHAPGGDEQQLVRIMPTISLRNYVGVAPRGLCPSGGGRDRQSYGWPQTADQIQEAGYRVLDSIRAAARKFHVARSRVFLAGFDAGGTMAFRVAMSDPGRFAGVLSVCGPFPTGHAPFGRLTQARQLPVFLAVGRDSLEYPPVRACEDLRLFHTAGMSVTLRQYPCAQELTPQMLRDMDRWIMEQITPSGEPPQDGPDDDRVFGD